MSFSFRTFGVFLSLVLMSTIAPLIFHSTTAQAQTVPVVINEFLALNETTLVDNTGEYEDWIELHNTTGATVDLAGWTISDGSDSFVFPAGTQIDGNAYRVLFASGDVARTLGNEIHLPFKLSGSGESLTLTDAAGILSTPNWVVPVEYPAQLVDDSYGIAQNGELRFFTTPTPGDQNGSGVGGIVEPVSFSLEHGYYAGSQTVVLDTATPNTTIRYTTNGDVPTSSVGTPVTPGTSLTISSTTTIRAVGVRNGWITSPVETRSYLFTADIINQDQPAGWPTGSVNNQRFDYEMDPEVVNGNEALVQSSLTGIPTISVVTDLDNLVDPTTGIYVNADQRGSDWERQAAVELIDPSGAQAGFDIEAGLRIRGGFSRSDANPKHAFRLYFRDDYEEELDYPLFGTEGVEDFQILDLRTSSNYGWSWRNAEDGTFIEELWSRDTQAAMGQPYTRSRLYHLYLNGVYWGLYMSQERVSGEYAETYFGGNEDDYDVVKRSAPGFTTEAGDGTYDAWESLYALVQDLNVTPTEFTTIESQVDLVNLADYYLLHFFTGDLDGSPTRFAGGYEVSNNWFALRNRNGVGAAAKWQFFDHDSEHSLCAPVGGLFENADNTSPWDQGQQAGPQYMAPGWLHEALITNPTYRQIFQDRVQLHMLTPGGALTVSEAVARFNVRAAEVSPAIEAESARWGDGSNASPYGRSDWEFGLQLKRDCFSQRTPIVEQQLRDDGLWPVGDPAVISPAAGAVPFGTNATISAAGQPGTIYFTTDGSDPRLADGSLNPAAQQYTGPITIAGAVVIRVRLLDGATWSPLAESAFMLSTPAGPVTVALNEFNAVSGSNFLGGGLAGDVANGTDTALGRVLGNGGDWFELVTIEDIDMRGWTFEVWNDVDGLIENTATLTLGNNAVLQDLRAGTILTISEDIADDVSYNPVQGDWHINLQSNTAGDGAYVTAGSQSNFSINNDDTQIAIFDAAGNPVQLRTGEGTAPNAGVSSTEVFKLEAAPTGLLTPDSVDYEDGTSSSWGQPNVFSNGAETQDLSALRIMFGDVDCDGQITIGDALFIAQFTVGNRTDFASCPLPNPTSQIYGAAGDVDNGGTVDIGDALLIAQCTVGLTNVFCND